MSTSNMNLEEVLKKCVIPERHSFFQLKNFVIGKECTPQAQMWQIVRELKVRRDNMEAIQLEIEEAKDMLEELEEQLGTKRKDALGNTLDGFGLVVSPREIRRFERSRKSLQKSLVNLESRLVYIKEEADYLLAAFNSINNNTSYVEFDNTEAQKAYWNEKIAEEINLRAILGKPIDVDLCKTALSLDDDMPIKQSIVQSIQQNQKRISEAAVKQLKDENGR